MHHAVVVTEDVLCGAQERHTELGFLEDPIFDYRRTTVTLLFWKGLKSTNLSKDESPTITKFPLRRLKRNISRHFSALLPH
jgi:hypothetical protein